MCLRIHPPLERIGAVDHTAKPQKRGRNEPCYCGSSKKYKRCCLKREQSLQETKPSVEKLPEWVVDSRRKLHQFEKYACNVFGLPQLLSEFTDSRREPYIPTFDVVNSLFHTAILRIPSINALEGNLKEGDFQQLIGKRSQQNVKVFSAEVVCNVLDKLDLEIAQESISELFWKAERNKVFREGSYATLRCVAIDGWEPFSSFHRHCRHCLVRHVKVKRRSGEIEEVEQYYHRFVVALLVGPVIDFVVGIEPVRNMTARIEAGESVVEGAEGEQSAALRLLDSLHETYATFIDACIFDGLYPNGPVMTKLDQLGYGAFIILKKEDNEPLKEALALWEKQGPCKEIYDAEAKEYIKFWDVDGLETLDTYKGQIRVIRAEVTKGSGEKITKRTWCVAIIGKKARKVGLKTALKITRSRWHIENTAFHQWVKYWNLSHVFHHTPNAIMALLLIWLLAFNLLQLFVYRRLKRPRRPKDPTYTIRHIVEVMLRDVATLPAPFPWQALVNTS